MSLPLQTSIALALCSLQLLPGQQSAPQDLASSSNNDAVLEAIARFNDHLAQGDDPTKGMREVTVVLDPSPPLAAATKAKPLKVTGKRASAPDNQAHDDAISVARVLTSDELDQPSQAPSEAGMAETSDTEASAELSAGESGLQEHHSKDEALGIEVESLSVAGKPADPSTLTLKAPFAPKPLGSAPMGWKLIASDTAPAFQRRVELPLGRSLELEIKPHLLVPEADGHHVFAVPEPGYQVQASYKQTTTIAAILDRSIIQLDEEAKLLGQTIDQLNQLLSSLPRDEE